MGGRRPEGAALLVAGHGAPGVGAFDASAVHTLGQIGEALLATGTPWQIRRLTASAGDRNAADRPTLKRSLVELASDPVRVAIVVLLGEIVEVGGELALVTGPEAREYPEDATLPLSWVRDRLLGAKAEHLVVAVSACGDGGADRWLATLGTDTAHHVIAVDAPSGPNRLVDALLTGLCGDALDPRTGTVTMASLSTHLARHAHAVQASSASETVAQPPPLAGLWDVRRSQLSKAIVKRAAGEPEDLTGTVLPGRFRIDRVVARGTFGTVYRARQLAVERDVAIKVLHAEIDPSSEDGRLFVHEIRSVGRIDHTNVVRIYQADMTHDGRLFFAMELLDGQDLQTLGAGTKLPRARAVELVRQLLAGLGAAHDAGLVHADIKPANAIVVSRAKKTTTTEPPILPRRKLVTTPVTGVPIDVGAATERRAKDAGAPAGHASDAVTARAAAGVCAPDAATPVAAGADRVTARADAGLHAADAAAPVTARADAGRYASDAAAPVTARVDGVPAAGVKAAAEVPVARDGVPLPPDASPAPRSRLDGTGSVAAALAIGTPAPGTNGNGRRPESAALRAKGSGNLDAASRVRTGPIPIADEQPEERVVLVDFGLARLRAPDRSVESAGGTPAYMAPEQLHEGRVDARSDLFSVALVLVWLMTGWRRPNAYTLTPPPEVLEDADLRAVIARALDKDPAKRFQTARELAAALAGIAPPTAPVDEPAPILPFRHLAPLTEADRGRLHGREADLGVITEHVLYRRAVIYTAPSGTGKTSMLRAGLLPRLEALGIHAVYVRCRADATVAIINAIAPGAATIADAITQFHEQRGGKLVIVIDQLEAALFDHDPSRAAETAPGSARARKLASARRAALDSAKAAAAAAQPDAVSFGTSRSRLGVASARRSPAAATSTTAATDSDSLATAKTNGNLVTARSTQGADDSVSAPATPAADDSVSARATPAADDRAARERPAPPAADEADVEAVLAAREDFVHAILGFDRWPRGADVSIVLSIREDYLARLLARTQAIETGIPIVRLPPLTPDGARAAIVAPLNEARLAIEPDLLDALLADLQRAAAAIGTEMGWGATPAVFPPHLQLACSVLYEALGPGDVTLSLAHYKRLGGFDAIVGEHLDRVIETELDAGRDLIARDLFLALVTGGHERAIRPESELLAIVGAKHGREPVHAVLEVLRSRGLLVRVRGEDEPSWELVHDSLVPRVLAWIDRKDLARRRAIELIRYHLRRSTPDSPSLLGRRELRELRKHPGIVDELDKEWQNRTADDALTPSRLVSRSRTALRRRAVLLASVLVAAFGIASFGLYRSYVEQARSREEASLRDRDLGRFTLRLAMFDWDPIAQRATPVPAGRIAWELRLPDPLDPSAPGAVFPEALLLRGEPRNEDGGQLEDIEARGGPAFLIATRPGCAPSTVPLQSLPGYTQRDREVPVIDVKIPSCQASLADTISIPTGRFIYGGAGEPASKEIVDDPTTPKEQTIELPEFRIDRTEVTNAAFNMLADMSIAGIHRPTYPFRAAAGPLRPVAGIDWRSARAYCQYLGRALPTHQQWLRALRGGLQLRDGSPNRAPRRNHPWEPKTPDDPAKLRGVGALEVVDVASFPTDRSPDGVLDLAGNVSEWLATIHDETPLMRSIMGGNVFDTDVAALPKFMAADNIRGMSITYFGIGVRCASNP